MDSSEQMQDEALDSFSSMGFTKELLDQIEEKKRGNPAMFVSAWQEDDVGIEKNQGDPETFLTAAEEGNINLLKQRIQEDSTIINMKDRDGYTALHRAAYNDHMDVVSFLLENGADSEARTNDGWTPLLSAANWANFRIIGRLLSHGVNANAVSNGGVTALHLAISSQADDPENVFDSVRYLLQAPGIDASVVSGSGDTPLMLARRSSKQIFELLSDFLNRK